MARRTIDSLEENQTEPAYVREEKRPEERMLGIRGGRRGRRAKAKRASRARGKRAA
jgi:hypothetical protein